MLESSSPQQLILPVQVEVQGIDSKAIKSTYTAFHTFRNGKTTLSCSGLLLISRSTSQEPQQEQQQQALVLAPLTCLYPFLQQGYRSSLAQVTADSLLPGVHVSALVKPSFLAANPESAAAAESDGLHRVPAALAAVLPLPGVLAAADQLLTSCNSTGGSSWKFGWHLADQQPLVSASSAVLSHVALLTVDLAQLLPQQQQQQPRRANSRPANLQTDPAAATLITDTTAHQLQLMQQQQQRCTECAADIQSGLSVAVCGSPFSCLAVHQFHGAVITGVISNVITSHAASSTLIYSAAASSALTHPAPLPAPAEDTTRSSTSMPAPTAAADMKAAAAAAAGARYTPPMLVIDGRTMPGMEGGPVVCRCCHRLLGLLTVPLSNSSSQAELMLAISIQHITAALAAAAAAGTAQHKLQQLLHQAVSSLTSSSSRVLLPGVFIRVSSKLPWPQQQQQQHPDVTRQPAYSSMHYQQLLQQQRLPRQSSSGSSALAAAQQGVVMIRVGRSWGSGVIMTSSGLVLTNAHIFGSAAAAGSSGSSSLRRADTYASVRLSSPPSSSSSSSGVSNPWLPARLLYRFEGYLDLAVLQVQHTSIASPSSSSSSRSTSYNEVGRHPSTWHQQQQHMLQPLELVSPQEDLQQGDEVYVVGHGLFGPGVSWPPAVTGGCVARIIPVHITAAAGPSSSSMKTSGPSNIPSMLITTAAVHGGASGGALVNAAGKLVGLVTSNAKHARGATLPHFNFCISASELRPVWTWAQQQQQQQPSQSSSIQNSSPGDSGALLSPSTARTMLQQLQAMDLKDVAGTQLWSLLPPSAVGQRHDGASIGGAVAAIDRLGRPLRDMKMSSSRL